MTFQSSARDVRYFVKIRYYVTYTILWHENEFLKSEKETKILVE